MANINDKLNKIINAIFGKDVRQALYDGLDIINKETEKTSAKQQHLEDTFDELIINAGNSNAEIVDARVDKNNGNKFEKIGDRLDQHSASLEQINNEKGVLSDLNTNDKTNLVNAIKEVKIQANAKAEQSALNIANSNISNLQSAINSLSSGSPKGVYATVSALQTAFPTGNANVYVVSADGGWYYWNTNSWTKGGTYQSTNIADKSITTKNIIPVLNYSIVRTGNSPLYTKNGTKITISGQTGNLYLLDDKGVELKSISWVDKTFVVDTNQMLIWNVDDNELVVLPNNSARNERNVVLLSNNAGDIQNGYLLSNELRNYVSKCSDHQIILSGAKLPTFTKNINLSITITFPTASSLYYIRNDGVELRNTGAYAGNKFTIGLNQMLIWNLDENKIIVQGNNDARNVNNVVLLNNTYIGPSSGFFKPYFDKWNAELSSNYSIVIGNSYPTFDKKGTDIIVNMPSGTMYLINNAGVQEKTLNLSGTSFILQTNKMLVWNVDDNEVVVIGNNDARNTRNIILLSNSYGIAQNGFFKSWFDKWETEFKIYNNSSTNPIDRVSKLSSVASSQGLTIVKDEIWGFNGSDDRNISYGTIKRYDTNTFELKTDFTHNLGHAASADYNFSVDTLIVGNGTSDETIPPRLDIIKRASSLCGTDGRQITFGVDNISIPFFTENKQIGGSGLIACFGEKSNIVYLLTGQGNAPRKIFKGILGTGAIDYSDNSELKDDATLWGTFIPGCDENEFNGTVKIIQTWLGEETDTYQGVCYYRGYLYLAVGNQAVVSIPKILKIDVSSNGNYKILEKREFMSDNLQSELEGICVYKGTYFLVCTINNGNKNGLYAIPIHDRQIGVGTTGTRVNLPFKCNSTPNITITPTSIITDLYIDNVDSEGFTVLSSSNGIGKFNWECMID